MPLRFSYDDGYFDDEYEVMPKISFTNFFENILNHKNIEVVLNKEALNHIKIEDNNILLDNENLNIPVIYTGALDELFNLEYGRLPYRSYLFKMHQLQHTHRLKILPVLQSIKNYLIKM